MQASTRQAHQSIGAGMCVSFLGGDPLAGGGAAWTPCHGACTAVGSFGECSHFLLWAHHDGA